MIAKFSYQEFIKFCEIRGINIRQISRKNIYVDMEVSQIAATNLNKVIMVKPLSNCRTDIVSQPIYSTLKGKVWDNEQYVPCTLESMIVSGKIIAGIKLLRDSFNLSLINAKNLWVENFENWKKEVGLTPERKY
jgi:hypothetical protein